jgi:hypothetical protein
MEFVSDVGAALFNSYASAIAEHCLRPGSDSIVSGVKGVATNVALSLLSPFIERGIAPAANLESSIATVSGLPLHTGQQPAKECSYMPPTCHVVFCLSSEGHEWCASFY